MVVVNGPRLCISSCAKHTYPPPGEAMSQGPRGPWTWTGHLWPLDASRVSMATASWSPWDSSSPGGGCVADSVHPEPNPEMSS
eukprot:139389-Pyramimonas_sp.AAC.1